ncbi:CsgG/HfaB family protein [Bradyrhizobium archetypum]|uniref:Curli production assembly protein CsgG n=1 Tax=Bradyrhizobium archetypum TaxID=2721160 RepID=A0A7Y4H5E7_9BRAD|nr:CsgG/HfaB family protein [Bradyrhizobium archetypum]NOJ47659.1 curli production assembly protein CsgG [Bradyrhizobium archetypum]
MGVNLICLGARLALASLLALAGGGCALTGTAKDPVTPAATLVPATKTGLVLESLPPPKQKLDVAVYNFPDLTGQNKSNDNFAEFSRAVTQGGSSILTDVLVKAGGGAWFDVAERADLQSLLQERQIIQNTRTALMGSKAQSLPPLRFAGVLLDGGVIGFDTNETTGGIGANYLGIGGNVSYRQDIVTVALRAVSVQTGRVLASVTTTKIIYSVNVGGNAFQFAAVDALLQADIGVTKNSPATLAVREGVQLAVYSLIFEGVKNNLWEFRDPAAGAAFMRELDIHQKALAPVNVVAAAPVAEPVVVTKN